jgi:hypothetical protein
MVNTVNKVNMVNTVNKVNKVHPVHPVHPCSKTRHAFLSPQYSPPPLSQRNTAYQPRPTLSASRPLHSTHLINARKPCNIPANPFGPDRTDPTPSYPLKFRHLQISKTRRHTPVANGYSTRYGEVINVRPTSKRLHHEHNVIRSRLPDSMCLLSVPEVIQERCLGLSCRAEVSGVWRGGLSYGALFSSPIHAFTGPMAQGGDAIQRWSEIQRNPVLQAWPISGHRSRGEGVYRPQCHPTCCRRSATQLLHGEVCC